jgi:ATP synthase protein I
MNIFARYIRLTFFFSLLLLMISSMCWFYFPSYQTYFAGYVLGLIVSIINGLITANKTIKMGDFATGKIKKMQGMGTLQRFLLAGFAGYTAMKYPDLFHWLGLLIGITTVTMLSLLIALILHLRKRWI